MINNVLSYNPVPVEEKATKKTSGRSPTIVVVCMNAVPENVKEDIEFAGQHIIIPFSGSQAHEIVDKYKCDSYHVDDIDALKKLIEEMKKYIHGKHEIIEINDIRWYPCIVDYLEILRNNDMYIEYYDAEIVGGYYGEYRNVKIHVTDSAF